jgi:hypothetical protein
VKSIRIKDLEIVEQEQKMEQIPTQTLAELTIENNKKDVLIAQLTNTVAMLSLEINKLKGGN